MKQVYLSAWFPVVSENTSTIGKQIIAFKKGTFAPPAPPTERQEGRLLPPDPLSGVPDNSLQT